MNDANIKKGSLNILDRLENLLSPKSVILKDLEKKKGDLEKLKSKKEEDVVKKKTRIDETSKEIEDLKSQSETLLNMFGSAKTEEFKTLIQVLKLSLSIDKDLEKIETKLPLQIAVRENTISDLTSSIAQDENTISGAKDDLAEVEMRLITAHNNQNRLLDLIILAKKGDVNKTREEVIEVLKSVEFNNEDAKNCAKLIMFPEDELIPYFKKINLSARRDAESDASELQAIKEELLKGIDKEEKEDTEIKLEEFNLEEDTPISFDELKSSLGEISDEKSVDLTSVEPELEESVINLDEITDEEIDNVIAQLEEEVNKQLALDEENANVMTLEEPVIQENNERSLEDTFNSIKIDDIEEKNDEVSEVKAIEPIVVEPTIEAKLSNDDEKELLVSIGKNEEDIKNMSGLLNKYSKEEVESMIKKVKDFGLDPKDIPLLAYKYGVDRYLTNLETLNTYGYNPDKMELDKFGAVLYVVSNEDLKANLETLKSYKLELAKYSGKLAFKILAIDPNELVKKIDLLVENNEIDLIKNLPDVLALDCVNIVKRINFCKQNNVAYFEARNDRVMYRTYIFDDKALKDGYTGEINLKEVTSSNDNLGELNQELVKELENYSNSDEYSTRLNATNDEVYFKYNHLVNKLNEIASNDSNTYKVGNNTYSINNTNRNIMYLVNKGINASDEDIIKVSLLYNSNKNVDEIKNTLEGLNK